MSALQMGVSVVGQQQPRIFHVPSLIVPGADEWDTSGPEVADLAASAGLFLDPWQQLFLNEALMERPDGTWAAGEVGLVVSRQNGKGSILEAVELGDLFLLDTEMTIHSAHLFDTSKEAMTRLLTLIESTPDLDRFISSHGGKVIHTNGAEGIELYREGKKRRLKFKTRTKGGGRGLTGDRVIVDEAMYYNADQDAALRPTLSARPNPQLWMTGSAGDKDSTQFGRMRQNALAGDSPRLVYMEWSIDDCTDFCLEDCAEHDPHDSVASYAKANPGLGIRISVEHIESERRSMDAAMFARERLGVGDWPVEGEAWRVIGEEAWMARAGTVSAPQSPYVFGIDSSPDRRHSCIVVAAFNGEKAADGTPLVHVEVTGDGMRYDYRYGTDWVVPRVKEIVKRHGRQKCTFVIDKASQAATFIDEMDAAGLTVISPTAREYAQACGKFHSSVVPLKNNTPDIVHMCQPMLNAAVAGAEKRELADVWAWDKRNAAVDISPLVAATLAKWGHDKTSVKPKPRPNLAWG